MHISRHTSTDHRVSTYSYMYFIYVNALLILANSLGGGGGWGIQDRYMFAVNSHRRALIVRMFFVFSFLYFFFALPRRQQIKHQTNPHILIFPPLSGETPHTRHSNILQYELTMFSLNFSAI
jgi:hypothetical protein